jgi:hypothetical protein
MAKVIPLLVRIVEEMDAYAEHTTLQIIVCAMFKAMIVGQHERSVGQGTCKLASAVFLRVHRDPDPSFHPMCSRGWMQNADSPWRGLQTFTMIDRLNRSGSRPVASPMTVLPHAYSLSATSEAMSSRDTEDTKASISNSGENTHSTLIHMGETCGWSDPRRCNKIFLRCRLLRYLQLWGSWLCFANSCIP